MSPWVCLQQQALPGTIELDMSSRTTRPTAQKRPKVAAPLDNASRAVRRLLAAEGDVAVERVTEQIPAIAPQGTGTERPLPEWVELNQSLYRVFAFVDVCGFTKYTDQFGAHAATEMLSRFRSACRDVTARRGARVAKWLGDGVMLVGTEPGPVIATVAELLLRFRDDAFEIHAGIAAGTVLLFEAMTTSAVRSTWPPACARPPLPANCWRTRSTTLFPTGSTSPAPSRCGPWASAMWPASVSSASTTRRGRRCHRS